MCHLSHITRGAHALLRREHAGSVFKNVHQAHKGPNFLVMWRDRIFGARFLILRGSVMLQYRTLQPYPQTGVCLCILHSHDVTHWEVYTIVRQKSGSK